MNQLILTVQRVYRKHVLDDDSIGWQELSDELLMTLCEAIGDRAFQEWLNTVANSRGR